jgi:hypothetical protein
LKQWFHFIVELLEFYLGWKNYEFGLSGFERMITRLAVSHPSSFVHQVLANELEKVIASNQSLSTLHW